MVHSKSLRCFQEICLQNGVDAGEFEYFLTVSARNYCDFIFFLKLFVSYLCVRSGGL